VQNGPFGIKLSQQLSDPALADHSLVPASCLVVDDDLARMHSVANRPHIPLMKQLLD
jgi:hypothetical protein